MGATIQPDRILHELSELWVSLGQQNGHESTGVLRACAMTLVVVADLPVILWFRPPRLLASPALKDLARIATKTVIDSEIFGDAHAALARLSGAAASGTLLGDLAWTRLTRWREMIAQIFENP